MVTTDVKSNLIHSKEIVNWVAFRHFCEHLKQFLIDAEKGGNAIIVEVWSFEDRRASKKKQDS
jgi:hypothetical protein